VKTLWLGAVDRRLVGRRASLVALKKSTFDSLLICE
jgi:hypothetical protein